ncbi:hypothetical protein RND81_03G234600 [Saponaria officinalis]|uniref:Uncharacterized protein n=1 Tax=Saponaria officinalis TaxID=3572 RepID=A0AAW1MAV5_SAPOF
MASSKVQILFVLISIILIAHLNGAEKGSKCKYVARCETQAECASKCIEHGFPKTASSFCRHPAINPHAPTVCHCCI